MNKKKRFIIFILLLPIISFSQKAESDFSLVDSFATTVKYKSNLSELTNELVKPFSTELDKARVIFRWITENIQYDFKYYNKYRIKGVDPPTFKCKNEQECEAKRVAYEEKCIEKAVKNNKAVCLGYALLYKKMCEIAGLKAEFLAGYVRSEPYQVGTAGILDHAWNAVRIDSLYYLLDVTWAAGGCAKDEEGNLLNFQKGFNDYYWLTPADQFARNHFPQNNKWTLLPNYTKDSFAANPYYLPGEIQHIKLISPRSGIIAVKKGDTIHFKVEYKGYFKDLQINSNLFRNPDIWVFDEVGKGNKVRRMDSLALKKQKYINYTVNGRIYEFQYVITDPSVYYLEVLFDRKRMLRFKINVDKSGL